MEKRKEKINRLLIWQEEEKEDVVKNLGKQLTDLYEASKRNMHLFEEGNYQGILMNIDHLESLVESLKGCTADYEINKVKTDMIKTLEVI